VGVDLQKKFVTVGVLLFETKVRL